VAGRTLFHRFQHLISACSIGLSNWTLSAERVLAVARFLSGAVPTGHPVKTVAFARFKNDQQGRDSKVTSSSPSPKPGFQLVGQKAEKTAQSVSPAPALRFDRRLIQQHHGEAVADRVDSVAGRALEALRILTVFQRLDAGRADQVFQQIFSKHDWALYDTEEAGPSRPRTPAGIASDCRFSTENTEYRKLIFNRQPAI
jgi:hypothetical protein